MEVRFYFLIIILLEFYILMIYIVKIVNCFELYLKKKNFCMICNERCILDL